MTGSRALQSQCYVAGLRSYIAKTLGNMLVSSVHGELSSLPDLITQISQGGGAEGGGGGRAVSAHFFYMKF